MYQSVLVIDLDNSSKRSTILQSIALVLDEFLILFIFASFILLYFEMAKLIQFICMEICFLCCL